MKTLLTSMLLLLLVVTSCEQTPKPRPKQRVETTVAYVLKAKKEQIETDYRYKFDPLNSFFDGKPRIRHQPKVSTVYYFVFTDGSHQRTNLNDYLFYEPGDTVWRTVWVWQ